MHFPRKTHQFFSADKGVLIASKKNENSMFRKMGTVTRKSCLGIYLLIFTQFYICHIENNNIASIFSFVFIRFNAKLFVSNSRNILIIM